ncbi:MAG: response regulator, partial [Oligoflexales bacterium]|nr:response regulator [Oligoflexales bacterium]
EKRIGQLLTTIMALRKKKYPNADFADGEGKNLPGQSIRGALETKTLTDMFIKFNALKDLPTTLSAILDTLTALTCASHAILFLKKGDGFEVVECHGFTLEKFKDAGYHGLGIDKMLIDSAIKGGLCDPVTKATSDRVSYEKADRSSMIVPLCYMEKVHGFVYLGHKTITGLFDVRMLDIIKAISTQMAIAIQSIDICSSLEQEVAKQTEKLLEQKNSLETAHSKLQELDKQKTGFFQNISHEIRTPLTLIINPLENLRKNDPQNQDVRVALQNSNRLFRLVNQLLDFQKLSAKKMDLKLEPIDIGAFLRACSEYFISICTSKNIRLFLDILSVEETYILGQTDALEKILFNYLSNAIKYSPEGGVIDMVSKSHEERVSFYIKDNGPGISKENQAKLFSVFSQTDDPAVRGHQGTGLGLALVKELAEAMKGEVYVESSPGNGALFGVTFMKYSPDTSRPHEGEIAKTSITVKDYENFQPKKWHFEPAENSPSDESDEESLSGDGKLILVIDDLKDMRDLITRSLKKKAYRVITAQDGIEGLAKISKFKPDLAVIDWMMPRLSGLEVIEKMVADSELKSIPTILLTAKSDEESKMAGIMKGAHAYLGKPFDELELLCTIENLIHLKEGDDKIKELNKDLTENVLKRFLPHGLVDDICSGRKTLDDSPKLTDVTILFSDLINFTNKAEDIGPHLMSLILNEYFDKMTEVVFEFGGTIDKFIGDGIMVIFGAPEEQSSQIQVEKAINCAIAMQSALKDLNLEWSKSHNLSFSMRIGIHKGSCIVGSFGGRKRSEYTAIGPAVNMASRIEKAATPGGIFFSSSVRDNLSRGGWVKAGIFELKGIGKTALFKVDCLESQKVA